MFKIVIFRRFLRESVMLQNCSCENEELNGPEYVPSGSVPEGCRENWGFIDAPYKKEKVQISEIYVNSCVEILT